MGIWYDRAITAKEYIEKTIIEATGKTPKPKAAVVLGTCFGDAMKLPEDRIEMKYSEIPGFTVSTVSGHAGTLIYCKIAGNECFIMRGRTHFYEGYDTAAIGLPIRVLSLMGLEYIILTNAAGGINKTYKVGDFVAINDHMSFCVKSPLIGPNEEEFGPRFASMDNCYDADLRKIMIDTAAKCGFNMNEGIYAYMTGPQFETHAEIRALGMWGADLVGMSTVPECIVARHAGVKVGAISCVTNMAAGVTDEPVNHESVETISKLVSEKFADYIVELIGSI